jgi:hypothetical protein
MEVFVVRRLKGGDHCALRPKLRRLEGGVSPTTPLKPLERKLLFSHSAAVRD